MSAPRREVIGDAELWLGDCREVLPGLGRSGLLLTDPPYGIGFSAQPTRYQRANGLTATAWDAYAPQELVDLARSGAAHAIIWGGNYFSLPPSRGWLCWHKSGNAPSMADLELAWTSLNMNARSFEKSVKSASLEKDLRSSPHPTQKPVALMEWSLGFVPASDPVIDPFMGSGTTGVACAKLGRPFVGVEIEEKYFNIACKRIEAAHRQADLFVERPTSRPEQATLALGDAA